MLNLAIDDFPPAALRRVLDAPVGEWGQGGGEWWKAGRACLYGHAARKGEVWVSALWRLSIAAGYSRAAQTHVDMLPVRFDRLCRRFGKPRIVRAVKLRAQAALERKVDTLGPTVEPEREAMAVAQQAM